MALTPAQRNPVAIRAAIVALVVAVVHVLVVFGLLDNDQGDAIGGVIDTAGLVILVLWARAGVTPNAKVVARVNTKGKVVAGDAAETSTGVEVPVAHLPSGPAVVEPIPVDPDLVRTS